ncbi:glycerol kinase GlpK [Leptodesmis sichuanensis]|uniref:glycerol kinase GlpK n=1 Tax=Leptodesmis sichuanensis TaxID=2906798 RepID=UPI001F468E77|nr:glycerol kinase GlpK [Leptodesmis sichuanensis]UIE36711.1 glycerol kinase GlpK [Leptodesmis sichuanensis A121]
MAEASAGYILALDLGTTGNRAFLFGADGRVVSSAYKELTQYYPQPGWLEHDPLQIWQDTCWVMQTAIAQAQIQPEQIRAIGLTVQRETCLLWDKTTGKPLHNAIVWQDRRTAPLCNQLRAQGYESEIYDRTGLVIDAYFSATKLSWLLDHLQGINLANVLAGTIDTWVLWNLTGRRVHATDHSNASRTMLLNLATGEWDAALLQLFQIPRHLLPEVKPSLGDFGPTDPALLGAEIPITAILGDQQAALFGHGCDRPGLMKCTYGTGCFLVAHTGTEIVRSPQQLISTVAWSQAGQDHIGYALEGSMFTTGACVQWLRDGLQIISTAAETEVLANQVADNGGVYFVPALSGLGAPHWDMSARGAFFGITGGVQRQHLVRAVLEAIAFQVKEVVQAVAACTPEGAKQLKVDGGACDNDFLMQLQADVLGIPIERPVMRDVTAQGAGFAAGLAVGFWDSYAAIVDRRPLDRIFEPGSGRDRALEDFLIWQKAVARAKGWMD